ncbi:hypothetical protein D3C85_1135540 [compost metagenome]
MLQLAIDSQIPGRHRAGGRPPEDAAAVVHQVIQRGGDAVPGQVGRCGADHHLEREQLAANHTLAGRRPDPEADIHAVQHPVADAIVELDIRLDAGMAATEGIEHRHEDRREARLRAHDAQRAGNLVLGLPGRGQRPVQCRDGRLGVLEQALPVLGQCEVAGRAVEQAHPKVLLQLRDGLARRLGADALRKRGAADTAHFHRFGEHGNGAELVDRHGLFPRMPADYQVFLVTHASRRGLVG